MRRATVNYWIDVVIAVAFLLSTLTGILFLLPGLRSVSPAGAVTILGVSTLTWHTIHDWSGVIAAAGVIAHVLLHLRWIATMTRRMALPEGRAARRVTTPPAAQPGPATQTQPTVSASSVGVRAAGVERDAGDDDRLSRRTFLLGLGAAAGATAFLGVTALLKAQPGSAAGTQVASSQQSGSGGWSQGGGQGGGSTQGDGGSTGSTDSVQRVIVDSAACVGCGRCLDVCPYDVFAWNGGKAAAQSPGACRLCGHCLQVCPAGAITLNG